MKKISVIIPVYNTKKELKRCLDSIAGQTYENLEIICVDDGSSDGSEIMIDKYASKDDRFKVIHQQNGGESNARNTGLKMVTGDVIAFCDCDDWIDKDMYQIMIDIMEKEDLDMVAGSWYFEECDKKGKEQSTVITNKLPVSRGIINNEMLLKYIYMRDSYRGFAYMWNKLYKKEILSNKYGEILLFDENIKLGGDVIYLAEAALKANRTRYIDRPFYHYNQRANSGCHTKDESKLRDWIKAYEIVIKRFEEENVEKEILDYVKRFLAYHSSNAAQTAYENRNGMMLLEFQRFMRKYENEYVELNQQFPERIERYEKIMGYII